MQRATVTSTLTSMSPSASYLSQGSQRICAALITIAQYGMHCDQQINLPADFPRQKSSDNAAAILLSTTFRLYRSLLLTLLLTLATFPLLGSCEGTKLVTSPSQIIRVRGICEKFLSLNWMIRSI